MTEWFGELPTRWALRRAKTLFTKENRPVEIGAETVTCFRDGQVTLRKNRRTTGFTEAIQEFGYQGVCNGDLVIHVMDAFAGAIGVSDSDGKCTPVYSVCTALDDSTNNYYYAYLLRGMAHAGWIQALYRGIRERSSDFRYDVFAMQLLPHPPREEQDQIVRYLDWKVSQINKLINIKKKQITLLQEQKQAVINRHLHSDKTIRLSIGTTKIGSGKTPRGGSAVYVESGVLFIRSQNVYPYRVEKKGAYYITDKIDEEMKNTRVYRNDVLLNITGGSIGRSSVYRFDDRANVNQHVCIIRTRPEILLPDFLEIWLNSSDGQNAIRKCQNAGNRESLTFVQVAAFEIPFFPVERQVQLISDISKNFEPLNKLEAMYNNQIVLLHEYRTRLISDVVTGKLDVRNVAIPDYEAVEEVTDTTDIETDETEGENDAD